jgi:hypothetical protein
MKLGLLLAASVLVVTGCGAPDSPAEPAAAAKPAARGGAFDPLVQSVERAKAVQQTVDAEAAEQRRRIEEAEK